MTPQHIKKTIALQNLNHILDQSRALFSQAHAIAAQDPASLETAARNLHGRIKALVDLADQSGVVSKAFMKKSGLWIDEPRYRVLQGPNGALFATVRHGHSATARERDHKPNDVRGDFAAAAHHVFRYANHVLHRGAPKHYGRIEQTSGVAWQQAILE